MAKPLWISVSPESGTGNGTIQVTAQAHTGRLNREGTITVATDGGASAQVAVTQTAHELSIVADEEQNVGATTTSATVTFTTNSQAFTLAPSAGVTIGAVTANSNAVSAQGGTYTPDGDPGAAATYEVTVAITFIANDTLESIDHTVTLADSVTTSTSDVAHVIQAEGTTRVSVDPQSLTFITAGETKQFSVSSNDTWTVS